MKKDDFKELVDDIEAFIEDLVSRLKELGMEEEVMEKFFEGEEVIMCPFCLTMNMMEISYDKQVSVYKCFSCGRTIELSWKK